MSDEHLLSASVGIGGKYPQSDLPGKIIEEKPGEREVSMAGKLAQLREQQQAQGDGNAPGTN